jgi:putative transposase
LAYCLMPNHFHFLIYASDDSAKVVKIGNIDSVELSNGFRLLQSNYARYINQKTNRSGSLFRQKAKAKCMVDGDINYQFTAFHYIHQNPYRSELVYSLEDWPFSSFLDFAGLRNGTLCDRDLAERLIDFDKHNFIEEAYKPINDALLYNIFDRRDRFQPSVGTEGQTDGS